MENRDNAVIIMAGGRIVHRSDKSSDRGSALSSEELAALLPNDLAERTTIQTWSEQPLSAYTLRMCSDIAHIAASHVREGARGVVVTCDMQAMTELAYFADLVWSFPQPLIFTASISYADSPNSETALRITQSVRAALSDECWGTGVTLCTDDALHAAANAVHLSNYRRPNFSSFPSGALLIFSEPLGKLVLLRAPVRKNMLDVETLPARTIAIVHASIGGGDLMLNALLDKRVNELEGLVISGFGDGNVPPSWVPLLRKLQRAEIPIVLTSRCQDGLVQPTGEFEGSARQLLDMGIISASSLSPLQARIRLALAIGAGLKNEALRSYMQAV